MLQSLKLIGVGPAPEMEMRFAPRLNVLTGDNGLGKSLFLETIWYVLTGNWAGMPAYPRPDATEAKIEWEDQWGAAPSKFAEAEFFSKNAKWVVKNDDIGRTPDIVIYARADGSVTILDPLLRLVDPIWEEGIFHFSPDEIINGIRSGDRVVARGLIEDWVSWQERRPETPSAKAFAHLTTMLETLSPNPKHGEKIRPEKPIRMAGDSRTFPTIDTGYGAIPIVHASAGMQRIINLAFLIAWVWHEHIEWVSLLKDIPVKNLVFLMDEVENHLHPEWQRRILPALLNVLESLGEGMQVQAHVTTHSPMVLASLEPHWDNERDELFHFALKEGKVVLESTELGRWGTASRWLKSHVFGLHADRSIEAERAMEDANALMRGEAPRFFKTPEEIDKELERTLWDQDPFWARWMTYMGKSKR